MKFITLFLTVCIIVREWITLSDSTVFIEAFMDFSIIYIQWRIKMYQNFSVHLSFLGGSLNLDPLGLVHGVIWGELKCYEGSFE